MIVYDKTTGIIINKLAEHQSIDVFYKHYPTEFRDNLGILILDTYPSETKYYKVVSNKLVKLTEREIQEINMYNKILSDEERLEIDLLNKLKPSYEEVKKAENTIEILTLLQEVM